MAEIKASTLSAFQLSARAAISAALAVALADAIKLPYPLYALVGAVIVTDLSPQQTQQLGLQRLAGTVIGAGCGCVFSYFLSASPLAIGFSIMTAMFLSHLFGLTGAAKVTGYVCGIILLSYQENQWIYALYRLAETILGVSLAIIVSFVPKLHSAEIFEGREC